MEEKTIPAREARTEIQVLNSRFIATGAPAFSVEEARAFIARVKDEFADATHNVPAFLIGHGSSVIAHCHDDGEPSGTAGRPALAVLQGSGLGDVVVVVTRYFGGTKLGTGGLVRAYGDAVRALLEVLPRARKVATHTVLIASPYPAYEPVAQAIEAHGGEILEQNFADRGGHIVARRVVLVNCHDFACKRPQASQIGGHVKREAVGRCDCRAKRQIGGAVG